MVTEGARTVSGRKKYGSASPSPFKSSIARKIRSVTNTIDIYHIKVLNTLTNVVSSQETGDTAADTRSVAGEQAGAVPFLTIKYWAYPLVL